jgi:hypothetical protein
MLKMDKYLNNTKPKVVPLTSPLSFISLGYLIINDQNIDVHVGELVSQDNRMEIGAAINAKDWVFALTKDVGSDVWNISGMHDRFQFLLEEVESDSTRLLVKFVVEKITPILYPELFTSYLIKGDNGEMIPIKWRLEQYT